MSDIPADPFETALADLRITGNVLLHERYIAPWAILIPEEAELRKLLAVSGESRVLPFHLVLEGGFNLAWGGAGIDRIATNEVVICTAGAEHIMSDGQARAPVSFTDVYAGNAAINHAGCPAAGGTTLLCGVFILNAAPLNPLLASLPPLLKLRTAGAAASPMLVRAVEMLALEVDRGAMGNFTASRLLEVFCAEAISAYRHGEGASQTGWFKAIGDQKIARAMASIHREPGAAWTVETLAGRVALSPSRFAARFRETTGQSVMSYVANWRMNVACRLLRETGEGLAGISNRVGYQDVAAFSRAFKALVGLSPSQWRNGD
jgi:AraC-like DNA-binding protein